MKSKMGAAERVFVCNFGSSRTRYSTLVSFPPEIDIPDTPDLSILRIDVILEGKSKMTAHP